MPTQALNWRATTVATVGIALAGATNGVVGIGVSVCQTVIPLPAGELAGITPTRLGGDRPSVGMGNPTGAETRSHRYGFASEFVERD